MKRKVRFIPILAALLAVTGASAEEDACHKVLHQRIAQCASQCLERAKAAVAPEIRDRVTGYECGANCAKLEMFNGHTCPQSQP